MKKTTVFIIFAIITCLLFAGCDSNIITAHINEPIEISGNLESYAAMRDDGTLEQCEEKHIEIIGTVTKVMSPTLICIGDYNEDNLEINCYFAKATEETKNINVGEYVKIDGVCVNTFGNYVYIRDCNLNEPLSVGTGTTGTKEPVTTDSAQTKNDATSVEADSAADTTAAHVHSFSAATCTAPKTCTSCKATEGSPLAHTYSNGYCTACNAKDPAYANTDMVWIPTHGGTKYHTNELCSDMIGPLEVTIEEAKVQGFTACSKCYN